MSSGEQDPDTMTATRNIVVYTYDSITTDCGVRVKKIDHTHCIHQMLYVIDSTVSNLKNVPFTYNFYCFGKQLLQPKMITMIEKVLICALVE